MDNLFPLCFLLFSFPFLFSIKFLSPLIIHLSVTWRRRYLSKICPKEPSTCTPPTPTLRERLIKRHEKKTRAKNLGEQKTKIWKKKKKEN